MHRSLPSPEGEYQRERFFLGLFERHWTKRSVLVAAEYLESCKTLETLDLSVGPSWNSHEVFEMVSLVLRALSRNTSVTALGSYTDVVRSASVAFQELLTGTQTLQRMELIHFSRRETFDQVQMAATTSGFANNTTLRDLEFNSWSEVDLAPVLTALQSHPTLTKIHFSVLPSNDRPSLSGLEVLLRNQDSKVQELILEQVDTRTVGLHPVLRELGRNTTVTNLAIRNSVMSHEIAQQLKSMLRQNTALQHLMVEGNRRRNAGLLLEIVPALYRNTSIKSLDLTRNGLDDTESATVLRELMRRNKSITSLSLAYNDFGGNAAAVKSILEGMRSNTALQQLDLGECGLDDQGMSFLANALAIRNGSILELNLKGNEITSVGVRALVDDNVEAVKTLTELNLSRNPLRSEGATILADALGCNAMPFLKRLDLDCCFIEDDGFVALVSALEQNTSLQILNLKRTDFGTRAFMALAESLPNMKGLQQITFEPNASFQSALPLLLDGFRKNTSLVEVNIGWCDSGEWSQELKVLGQRNRFTPLLKASDPPNAKLRLGIWSRALAKVSTEPDVLFHVLGNKPKLVGSAGGSKKRKRDDE
jgi:Ran GTPase-activating protein (RanGAP) involved in mRNA processing and transport